MNWTSIKNPLWRADCEKFQIDGKPFEVRDVRIPAEVEALLKFAEQHDIFFLKDGDRVWFRPGIPRIKLRPSPRPPQL
jgi:hypothetical protein